MSEPIEEQMAYAESVWLEEPEDAEEEYSIDDDPDLYEPMEQRTSGESE